MADQDQYNEEQKKRREDEESRGAGSGENAVATRHRTGGVTGGKGAAYRTGGLRDDGGTGTTGAAEEGGEGGGGNGEDEEDAELPKEMFPEGKSEEDYEPDNYNPISDYPPGDPAEGMPDYNELAKGVPQYIAMRDYRAYLVSQAVKNERANDELQARFVKGLRRGQKVYGILNNPDYMRDTSMANVEAQMKTYEKTREYVENFKKQRMKEQAQAAATAGAITAAANQTASAGVSSEKGETKE